MNRGLMKLKQNVGQINKLKNDLQKDIQSLALVRSKSKYIYMAQKNIPDSKDKKKKKTHQQHPHNASQ